MSNTEVRLRDSWMGLDEFVGLLQKSLHIADLRLAREPMGDIQYAVADVSISAPVDMGVDAKNDRPVLRLPSSDELVKLGGNVTRLTFTLRPVPSGEEPRISPTGTSKATDLIGALSDQDYRERLRAVKALGSMGNEALGAIEVLRAIARSDRSKVVRQAAADAIKEIIG